MAKALMNDLVILLPGISGSVLQRGGKDVWNVSGQAVLSALFSLGGSIRSLALDASQDDIEADRAPDGVEATAMIADAHLVPGLCKVDGYTQLFESLFESFDLDEVGPDDDQPGNLVRFPYDWRRDVRATARQLRRVVARKLDLWRANGGTKDSRVILVAHSMGGLVSQHYLEALDGWPDCRALITFGTPYRGSVKAIDFLTRGMKMLGVDLSATLRSFPSVYQLLPRYPVIATDGGGGLKRVVELTGPLGLDQVLVAAHVGLHQDLDAASIRHAADARYLSDGYVTIPVVGTRQPTLLSASWDGRAMAVARTAPPGHDPGMADGDGTVPRVSAIPLMQSKAREFRGFFVSEQHAALQNQAFVLGDLVDRLKLLQDGKTLAIQGGAAPSQVSPLSLEIEDLYGPGEPVTLAACAADARDGQVPALVATVEAVSGGSRVDVPLEPGADGWARAALTALAPGLYRVEVAAAGVDYARYLPVHTLFEYAGAAAP
jgi:pimeloyl-ACP methyl ester carboxylesterase